MTDNRNWLAEYAKTGSDAAFRELVTRYVDLVYSTALRLVDGDAHRAEDVAQTVFLNLARLARTLPQDLKLGGWLHRDTCFTAATLMRGERRRQTRERQAVEMNALQTTPEPDFKRIAPLLDEAINELGDADRTAVLLRFFEQHDFRAVGLALGSNEDAARMRVNRALEKLQELLKRRGLTSSAAALSVVLSANGVHAAPAGLALAISTATALTGATFTTIATATATKAIAMTALQKTLIAATVAVLAGAGIYEARQVSQLREQNQTLQQQQAPLVARLEQLQRDHDDATSRLALMTEENRRLNQDSAELLRLRAEATRTQRMANDQFKSVKAEPTGNSTENDLLSFAAREIRHSATNSILGDVQAMTAKLGLTPAQAEAIRDIRLKNVENQAQRQIAEFTGKLSAEDRIAFDSAADLEKSEISAVLTPDQQAAYKQIKKDRTSESARRFGLNAASEMKDSLNLTQEQQLAVATVLSEVGPANALAPNAQEQLDARLRALEPILTPEQLQTYRQQMLEKIQSAGSTAGMMKTLLGQ